MEVLFDTAWYYRVKCSFLLPLAAHALLMRLRASGLTSPPRLIDADLLVRGSCLGLDVNLHDEEELVKR